MAVLQSSSITGTLSTTGVITISKTGTLITHSGMSDAIGYNSSYGTYIGSPVGGTYYLYANGTFFDAGTIRTLIHSGNIGSQSVSYATTSGTAIDLNAADATEINFNKVTNTDYSTMTFMSRAWSAVQGANGLAYNFTTHTNAGGGGYGAFQIYYGESGYVYAPTSFRAPIFYDSNDTTYYVDPNSTSRLESVWIRGANFYDGRLYVGGSSAGSGLTMNFDQIWTGSGNLHLQYSGSGNIDMNYGGGYTFSRTSLRAPIFYDYEDTAYYVDPNSNSKLLNLGLGNVTPDLRLSVNGDSHMSGILYMGGTAGSYNSWGSRTYTTSGLWYNNSNGVEFNNYGYGSTWSFTINGGNAISSGSMRAPIFYDSNDTGYYLDPNASGTSLRIAGNIYSDGSFGSNGYSSSSPNVVSRIFAPKGAAFSSDGSTGAIRIKLPFRANNPMWTMKVRIYNYSTNQTSEYLLGNYAYDQGGYNSSATFIGGDSSTAYTVRFGNQDGVDCVWIGETNTSWSYPVVSVLDFTSGFRASDAGSQGTGWNISMVTSFGTVAQTITPNAKFSGLSAYSIQGTSNVAGTGSASYHPSGIYSTGNNWLYGTMYMNGNDIYDVNSTRAYYYYDRSDTAYYTRPSATSRMNSIVFDNLRCSVDQSYGFLGRNVYADTLNAIGSDTLELNYYDGGEVHIGSSYTKTLRAGVLYSRGASYGTVFYDTDNSAYYGDFNDQSRFLALKLGNQGTFNSGGTYPLQISSSTRYQIALCYNNSSYYPWLVNDSAGGYEALVIHFNGIGDKFYFNRVGNMYASGTLDTGGAITAGGIVFANYGTRIGEIWGYGGVYRSSGDMMFGTETGGWRFHYQNSQRVYIGTDGNIWMQWAGAYMSDLLAAKQNASTAITTSNIGSQSVSYASSAGNASTVGGIGVSTLRGSIGYNSVSFYVNGDANTYYPVLIGLGGQFGFNRYSISRGYSDPAPWDPIGTGSHRGGLTLTFDCSSDIAWGGNDKSWRIIQFAESYTTMVAGMALPVTGGIIVWLRGGGAYYQLQGPNGINHGVDVYYSGYSAANGAFYGTRSNTSSVSGEILSKFPIRGYGDGDIYVNNNAVIHAGNIGSQSVNYASNSGALNGWGYTSYAYRSGGSGYYQINDWMQMNGGFGMYWPSYYGLHIYPNLSGSYGALQINGEKNGWSGAYFNNSAVSLMMNASESGHYRDGWQFRWYYGTMYVSRGSTGGGTEYTVLDSGNYTSWAVPISGTVEMTGEKRFTTNNGGYAVNNSSSASLQAFSTGNNTAFMSFHRGGYYAVNFGLDQDNWMRIGGWSASSNRWQLNLSSGDMYAAGDITAYSDARVKTNIVTIENPLEKALALRGVTYTRTDSDDKKTKMGVIAQEVLEVIPEVVNQDNDGIYSVAYGNMVGLLIEAMKEQQQQIETLKNKLDELTK